MLAMLRFFFFTLFPVLYLNIFQLLTPFDDHGARFDSVRYLPNLWQPDLDSQSLCAVALEVSCLGKLLHRDVFESVWLQKRRRQRWRWRVFLREALSMHRLIVKTTLPVLALHVHPVDVSLHFLFHFLLLQHQFVICCLSATVVVLALWLILFTANCLIQRVVG